MKKIYSFLLFLCLLLSVNSTEDYEQLFKDYKDIFSESQQVTTHSNQPVTINHNFTYTFVKNVLSVSFGPLYLGYDYVITVKERNNLLTRESDNVYATKQVETYTFQWNDITPYKNYYIMINIKDFSFPYQSQAFTSELLYLGAYKTSSLDCNTWLVNLLCVPNPQMHSLAVQLTPVSKYTSCFQLYVVELRAFHGGKCVYNSTVYQVKNVTYKNDEMSLEFNNLTSGNYCFDITAQHEYCPAGKCLGLRTRSIELEELKENDLPQPSKHQKKKDTSLIIIVPTCISILIMVIGIIFKVTRIISKHKLKNKASIFKDVEAKTVTSHKKLILPVLYARDIEKQHEVVKALNSFLKECCHAESIIPEDNPEFRINSSAWIHDHFNFSKLIQNDKNGIKCKAVIIETDPAVRLYQALCRREILQYREYDCLNDYFTRGITQLINTDFDGRNYHSFVVVSFSYVSLYQGLNCFPQKRINLPYYLVHLYNSLWDRNDPLLEEEKLLNEWRKKDSYKNLIKAIEEMATYVNENPKYLDDYVFGDSDLV